MKPVMIDLSGVIQEFTLSKEESKALSSYVLSNISDEYMRNWEKNIETSLKSTRTEYKAAIFTEKPDEETIVFGMTPRKSKLGLMLEEGASEFDIKEGMKNSSKKKRKKNGGWYLTVPFRHATSEAIAESAIFSSVMPSDINKLVKVAGAPLKLSDLPVDYREKRTSRVGYQHKAAIYEGLKRQDISSTSKEKRGGYFTFRRISDNSDDKSWQHPGFELLKLMEKSLNDMQLDLIVDRSIDDFLKTKFGE